MIKKYFASALIFSAFLLPGFQVVSGLPVIRAENILVLLIFMYGVGKCFAKGPGHLMVMDKVTKSFTLMAFAATISITLPAILFDTKVIINDTMIFPMLFLYWMIYRFFLSMNESRSRLYCLNAILVIVAICAGIGVIQYFNLIGINYWLTPHYVKGSSIQVSLISVIEGAAGARIGGTHGDPRHYGYLLVVGICVCTSWLLHNRSKKLVQWFVICTVGICILSIAFTLSRTTILSTAVCITVAFLIYMKKNRSHLRVISIIVAMVILFFSLSTIFYTESFQERIMRTDTISFANSRNARIRDLLSPFDEALENPIIFFVGKGPSKAEMRTDSHNDLGWYFHRFGLPGLFFYMALIIWSLKRGSYIYKHAGTEVEKTVILSSFLVMLNWAIFAMAENIFKDGQLMAVNMVFMGFLYPRRAKADSRKIILNKGKLKSLSHYPIKNT